MADRQNWNDGVERKPPHYITVEVRYGQGERRVIVSGPPIMWRDLVRTVDAMVNDLTRTGGVE